MKNKKEKEQEEVLDKKMLNKTRLIIENNSILPFTIMDEFIDVRGVWVRIAKVDNGSKVKTYVDGVETSRVMKMI